MIHHRRAGRVILLDNQDRLLLLQGHDPSLNSSHWWFTPGGGAEERESEMQAAIRELSEETGLLLQEVAGPIWTRHASFDFNGDHYEQREQFFFARVDSHDVERSGWTDLEQDTVLDTKWWSQEELATTDETIYPLGLAGLVRNLLEVGLPSAPIEISAQQ